MDPESTAPGTIVVLGMHRSGTSLISRMLEAGGVYFGAPEDLAPPAEDNVRGFWEHLEIRAINEELLARLGGDWRSPPPSNERLADDANDDLRERARDVLRDLSRVSPLTGWKDPRTTLVLPFWRALLGRAMHPVLCVRHPRSVAASLERRDGMPLVLARFLWREYSARAVADLGQVPVIVSFEEVLRDPLDQSARLAAALAPTTGDLDAEAMVDVVEPELSHYDLSNDGDVATEGDGCEEVFAQLRECGDGRRAWANVRSKAPERDEVFGAMMKDSARLASRLSVLENTLLHRERETDLMRESIDVLRPEIEELRAARRALEERLAPDSDGGRRLGWARAWKRLFSERGVRKSSVEVDE